MKGLMVGCALLLMSCGSGEISPEDLAQQELEIKAVVYGLHASLDHAYSTQTVDTDSLIEHYYAPDTYYVTPWGNTEPLDSTKWRIRTTKSRIKEYQYSIENLRVRTFNSGGYAFFILRQAYAIDGYMLDEYLPTTFILERREEGWRIIHVQRTTDYQTIQQYVEIQRRREEDR